MTITITITIAITIAMAITIAITVTIAMAMAITIAITIAITMAVSYERGVMKALIKRLFIHLLTLLDIPDFSTEDIKLSLERVAEEALEGVGGELLFCGYPLCFMSRNEGV